MKNLVISVAPPLLSAGLLSLASPGVNLWFFAYLALVPMLLWISFKGSGFLTGFLFGLFYYPVNIRWITVAVSEFGNAPLAVGILITLLLSAVLALFWGIFGRLYQKRYSAPLLMAGLIVTLEIVKSNIFSGFPILNLSHTQYTFLPAIQIAEITGEYGISLVIAYVNISTASLITDKNRQSAALALILLAASFSYGFLVQKRDYAGTDLNVRIIQPAYSQADKWIPENKYDIMADVNSMLRNSNAEKYDLLLLPETVYPAFLNANFAGYHMLEITGERTKVVTGGIRYTEKDKKRIYHNSAFLFDKGSVSIYDKLHLVPFGEYFPFKTLFKPIDYYFFKGAEDFTPGAETRTFDTGLFNAAPLICYESMYSSLVREQVMLGADILTVVTNDSWFGHSTGPYQHVASDVLRAAEFRKPLLRAAQSGPSACIKPSGEIIREMPLDEKGYLDCSVTTHKGLTLFASGGYGWLAALLFLSWYFSRRRKRERNSY